MNASDSAHSSSNRRRLRLRVRGRVQGVGFRPFVFRLAHEHGLAGFVGNDADGVFIEAEGGAKSLEIFRADLSQQAPPAADVYRVESENIPVQDDAEFHIVQSRSADSQQTEIAPDMAVCDDCLRELFTPDDRRYQYPFINCTNCGPRYSIVKTIPYDRPQTTMAAFEMCGDCRREYEDPANRRFHAQPIACPVCGPRVWMADGEGREIECADVFAECARRLDAGEIVAIKGLGGFHLACRADNNETVELLRKRKGREAKPFALMAADLEMAKEMVDLSGEAGKAMGRLLESMVRPIVLLPRRSDAPVSDVVAPHNPMLGIMLPYTPMHHLIFSKVECALVMTSGNPSDEPLCADNDEAMKRLAYLADAFLLHDRDIERRVDDSVMVAMELAKDKWHAMPLRRARGYVPAPVRVSLRADEPVLALGGEMKSTVCILKQDEACLSEHLGELSNPAAYRNFVGAVAQFERLMQVKPRVIACDLHPNYASTRYCNELVSARKDARKIPVQHHHAHLAACLAENGESGRAIGLICDGTGYGDDGTIWGGEILVGDCCEYARAGHLKAYPLAGGDAAARDCWRPALGLLMTSFDDGWREHIPQNFFAETIDMQAIDLVARRLDAWKAATAAGERPAFAPAMTSSMGRLFDGVSFLLGICARNRYEAEAAMRLEAEASRAKDFEILEYAIIEPDKKNDALVYDFAPLLRDIVTRHSAGESTSMLARSFHETLAKMLVHGVECISARRNLRRVALSGGCFANRILLRRVYERLMEAGMEPLPHRQTPTGDGCVALGQAVVAAEKMRR